jgi:hypothetical protein
MCKQMDHALPDSLRSDLGLSKTDTAQTTSTWSEESHSMHLSTISSEVATGAANLDQTNLCCYCFTRRADHLIIDCREFLPILFQTTGSGLNCLLTGSICLMFPFFLLKYALKLSFHIFISFLLALASIISSFFGKLRFDTV